MLYEAQQNIHHTQSNQIYVRLKKRVYHGRKNELVLKIGVGNLAPD